MGGYLVILGGLCFAIAGGASGCWWLELLAFVVATTGFVMVERQATEGGSRDYEA